MNTQLESSVIEQSLLNFTDNAAIKVKEFIDEEGNAELKLRLYIEGGGCSGFKYNFSLEETTYDDDTIIAKSVSGAEGIPAQVKLLVDPLSLQYLIGAEVDYRDDLEGGHFVIRNPNSKTTCGCGSSFSV